MTLHDTGCFSPDFIYVAGACVLPLGPSHNRTISDAKCPPNTVHFQTDFHTPSQSKGELEVTDLWQACE